ncbi:MAG: hypothetical protein K8T89_09855, partial [Planctomycetes bacterium]|nr:hypothetical protein [Planctomycetota bacterium]
MKFAGLTVGNCKAEHSLHVASLSSTVCLNLPIADFYNDQFCRTGSLSDDSDIIITFIRLFREQMREFKKSKNHIEFASRRCYLDRSRRWSATAA